MADIQTNSDSSIYRVLIKNLIDNKNVWLNGNAQKMIEEFPIIDSTYQFMNSMRKSFTYKQLRYILGQICNEARAESKKRKMDECITSSSSEDGFNLNLN